MNLRVGALAIAALTACGSPEPAAASAGRGLTAASLADLVVKLRLASVSKQMRWRERLQVWVRLDDASNEPCALQRCHCQPVRSPERPIDLTGVGVVRRESVLVLGGG